jgi:hypothetical protein
MEEREVKSRRPRVVSVFSTEQQECPRSAARASSQRQTLSQRAPSPLSPTGGEILDGLIWLEKESQKRFKHRFVALTDEQKRRICDDICYAPRATSEFKTAANFFAKFRNLTAGGFYTTPQGWKDLQYLGNIPLTRFDGPPPEVLAYLKLG